jgi:hypothetical protein
VAYSTRTIGIVIASVLAVASMLTAVIISGPLPFHINRADAESTHDLLVAYAAKDSDNDTLPDWQEALYGTDPNNPHSVNATVLDGEAVAQGLVQPKFATATSTSVDTASIPGSETGPQTVTDQFARALFAQYLSQRGNTQPTPEEIATFVEQGVVSLRTGNPSSATYTQVRTGATGPEALRGYAASTEQVFQQNSVTISKSEVDYLADAIERNDKTALTHIREIGTMYGAIGKAYMAISVPPEVRGPHLSLANALAAVSTDIADMATMQSDPLRCYLGLANYQNDVPKLQAAFASLNAVYAAEQVIIPEGAAGSQFYNMITAAARASTAP